MTKIKNKVQATTEKNLAADMLVTGSCLAMAFLMIKNLLGI